MKEITVEKVRNVLESNLESDEPDAILEILRKYEGKQLTKRILPHLPGGAERWYIRNCAGMTSLEDREYLRHNGGRGISLLVAHQTINVTIDTAKIIALNTAYFTARVERNSKRREALKSGGLCGLMSDLLNEVAAAQAKLDKAKAELTKVTGYGEMMSPDQYEWERLAGIREERK